MPKTCKVYIIGVGGQGIGAASRVLMSAARIAGINATSTETHGLAQRGGVVVSTLRLGEEEVFSPLIAPGEADVLFALEPVEALRAGRYLRKGGLALINTSRIDPLWVRLEKQPYPPLDEITAAFDGFAGRVIAFDATAIAVEEGSWISSNAALLGCLAATEYPPFPAETLREGVRSQSKGTHLERNLRCFDRGLSAAQAG